MDRKYFVRCQDGCLFESMTKEQILTAIIQAVNEGTISDIDSGFVTKITEQNTGEGLTFWVGTQAEYNALAEKVDSCFYIITDDTTGEDIEKSIKELQQAIDNLPKVLENYAPLNNAEMKGLKILTEPTEDNHAVTKKYVDENNGIQPWRTYGVRLIPIQLLDYEGNQYKPFLDNESETTYHEMLITMAKNSGEIRIDFELIFENIENPKIMIYGEGGLVETITEVSIDNCYSLNVPVKKGEYIIIAVAGRATAEELSAYNLKDVKFWANYDSPYVYYSADLGY